MNELKLTNTQLETLKNVADPNYKSFNHGYWDHSSCFHYFTPSLKVLAKHGLVDLIYRHATDKHPDSVRLTSEGRTYLDNLGIEPVALRPPTKTREELKAENKRLIALVEKIYAEAKEMVFHLNTDTYQADSEVRDSMGYIEMWILHYKSGVDVQ